MYWSTRVLPRKCDRGSTSLIGFHEIPDLALLVLCPIVGVLEDVFGRFMWTILSPNNSTSSLGTATFVAALAVNLHVLHMERMRQVS